MVFSVLSPMVMKWFRHYDSNQMTENLVDFVVVALLGVVTALACIRFLRNDPSSREVDHCRDEIEIDPAKLPEFKPPWRDMPHGDQAR